MQEVSNFYDLIEAIRKHHGLNSREFARSAQIPYTTLVSLVQRRPQKIRRKDLIGIASVFNLEWYELINKPEYAVTWEDELRIPIEMTKEDIEKVKERFPLLHVNVVHNKKQVEIVPEKKQKECKFSQYRRNHVLYNGCEFLLNILNEEGLMEATRRILDVANDPKYRGELK